MSDAMIKLNTKEQKFNFFVTAFCIVVSPIIFAMVKGCCEHKNMRSNAKTASELDQEEIQKKREYLEKFKQLSEQTMNDIGYRR